MGSLDREMNIRKLIGFLRGCPEGFNQSGGLCFNIAKFDGYAHNKAIEAMYSVVYDWEYYSGDPVYPIMGEVGSALDAFTGANNMYSGEYGRRRIELANLIADELEK